MRHVHASVPARRNRRLIGGLLGAVAALATGSSAALSAPPPSSGVALVEDIDAPSSDVQFMDYLKAGQVIRLRAGEKIVIDYLGSCGRETIAGGTITIGSDESIVAGGQIHREKVECDGGKMLLTADQANKSGAMVFRKIMTNVKPSLTLYGASPMIAVAGGGKVMLDRLDQGADSRVVEVPAKPALYDFARHNQALAAGGVYRASIGDKSVVFKIAEGAKPGVSPLVGRLIQF